MVKVGLDKVAAYPGQIGLQQTTFIHGFSGGSESVPRQRVGANSFTANDANLFWKKLYDGELLNSEMTGRALNYAKLPNVKIIYHPDGAVAYHKPGYIWGTDETYIDAGIVETPKFAYAVSFFSRKNPDHNEGGQFSLKLTKMVYDFFSAAYP
jgi:hypothetical protein